MTAEMPDRSIRWEFAERLVTELRNELGTVEVDYGFRPNAPTEFVYIAAESGRLDVPVAAGERLIRDDNWTVDVVISVLVEGGELGEAVKRREEIAGQIENYLAAAFTLAPPGSDDGLEGLFDVVIGDKDGTAFHVKEGAHALASLTLEAHARAV